MVKFRFTYNSLAIPIQWIEQEIPTFLRRDELFHPYLLAATEVKEGCVPRYLRFSKFPGNCGIIVVSGLGMGDKLDTQGEDFNDLINVFMDTTGYTRAIYTTNQGQTAVAEWLTKNEWVKEESEFKNRRTKNAITTWHKDFEEK